MQEISFVLMRADTRNRVEEVYRNIGIPEAEFYNRKTKAGHQKSYSIIASAEINKPKGFPEITIKNHLFRFYQLITV